MRCPPMRGVSRAAWRDLIIFWLEEAYEPATWLEAILTGWRGAWMLNPLDPFGSLLEEAIRRAEAKALSLGPLQITSQG